MTHTEETVLCPFGEEWKVIREIGHGSYGSVYLIERVVGNEKIQSAMKVIRLPASEDEPAEIMRRTGQTKEEIARYYQSLSDALLPEIQMMSSLRGDSHIVSYEDHYVQLHASGIGMDIYIRMEYLESLPHWLNGRELTNGDVAQIGIQLCEGLSTCARNKIIHRDIKPDNIFVTKAGTFKLGDFGIAQRMDSYIDIGDRKLGSLNYIAPEVRRGEDFDERADIYGLGMVLYRILNNDRIPFLPPPPAAYTDAQEEAAREKRFNGDPLPKPEHASDILWAIIEKACAFHPDGRYRNAAEMETALRNISRYGEIAKPLPAQMKTVHKDSETSPRTRSVGPNGTGRRQHETITQIHIQPVQKTPDEPEKSEEKENDTIGDNGGKTRKTPSKTAVIAGISAAAALAVILGFLFFHPSSPVSVTGTKQLGVTVQQNADGAADLKISGGKKPYHVSVLNKSCVVDEIDIDDNGTTIGGLVPGTTYSFEVSDSKDVLGSAELATADGALYSGAELKLSSMIIYECDRQDANGSDWWTLSGKNRTKQLTDNRLTLRDASAAAQKMKWFAVVTVKGSNEAKDTIQALIVLRLSNGTALSQQISLNVSSGMYSQTPIDLDPLLEKTRKACGGWISGDGSLELYVEDQFLTQSTLTIS